MDAPATIGLDLAKNVLQAHRVDANGAIVLRRQLRPAQVLAFFSRLEPCLVGMQACESSLLGAGADGGRARGCG